MRIARFSRAEFLAERWHYRPGEHVAVIGPTQIAGKTKLILDLLENTPAGWCKMPPTMLVAKPKDPTVTAGIARLGYKEISSWPPRKTWLADKPPGYALWPRHLQNVPAEVNDAYIAEKLKPALHDHFWKGSNIVVADEFYHLCAVLGLQADANRHLTQGMGMGSAFWYAVQKPSGTQQGSLPSFAFNSATHTFLGRDPDSRNRKRFGEIGGVDGKLVEEVTFTLPPYSFLYIHRAGPKLAIVEAS